MNLHIIYYSAKCVKISSGNVFKNKVPFHSIIGFRTDGGITQCYIALRVLRMIAFVGTNYNAHKSGKTWKIEYNSIKDQEEHVSER
ncbi:hypothetical protein CMK17_00165 [Candidatus Poribacteria bacterium]|nr:hypothetical protein [Candidatus Poribacteria bacterium]